MSQEEQSLEGSQVAEPQPSENSQDEFIQFNEVDQELAADDGEEPMDEDDEIEDDDIPEESVQIDLSNNSVTYFDKHTDSVFTIFHHPSLPLVCSGGGDNLAHLWTSHSQPPKFAGSLQGHTESVIAGGFSSDGNLLVTADMTGKVIVHASQKGGSRWKLVSELQEVEEVIWLKCHPTIPGIFAFGATDGSVWCYQTDSNGSLEQLMSGFAHQEDCTAGEFINVDKGENVLQFVTAATDGSIVGWNGFTGQQLFKISKEELKGLETPWVTLSAAPPSGNAAIVACGSNNGVLALINGNNGSVLHLSTVIELQPDQDDIMASVETISWSTKLPLMAVGLVCGNILIYDVATWRVRHKIELEDAVTKLLFDNENLFASCINGKVYQFDPRSGQEKYVCLGHNMGILDFIIVKRDDENSTRLITAGDEGVSLVFDIPN